MLPSIQETGVLFLAMVWCHLRGKAKKEGLHVTRVGKI
jgi:hypothetical protein